MFFLIGLKYSRHFLSQSEVKPKPNVTRSRTFSRVSYQSRVFASSFDWFAGLSVFFVIGQSNYFGFGFTTLKWKFLLSRKHKVEHSKLINHVVTLLSQNFASTKFRDFFKIARLNTSEI